MKKIPELLILFALFVSPLLHNSLENSLQTRRMWSWCALISVAIIGFFTMYPFRVQKFFLYFFASGAIISVGSIFISVYPPNSLALYSVTLILFLSLAFNVALKNNPAKTLLFATILIGFCTLYAQWGIAQFIFQRDLGMAKIGESVLNNNIPGVASFYIQSEKYIRAYGPFAHANSFAGVLLLGVIVLYRHFQRLSSNVFTYPVLFIISLGIVSSFSRTALVGLAVMIVLFVRKKIHRILFPLCIIALLFSSLVINRSTDSHGVALKDRLVGLSWYVSSANIPSMLRGTGIGNYTTGLTHYLQQHTIPYEPWDIAPIHSVPVLLLAELGIILGAFLILCIARYTHLHTHWIFLALLPALFFDHYFVTQFAPSVFLIISARLVVQWKDENSIARY